ncbi:hypothetical protein BLNAU_20143 [Blattamonas nauphoetae]|uniref:Uncharacterized protein n=1 Tax=Blattamonas nauphoetae TaxID=2049346 RepID=A0ABQ9X211_9EUKA|nr:hypothetical protein BLNAU_20143 [Blattamonas nauphoetae]
MYEDFRQLVTDVKVLKEEKLTLQKRVDHLESDLEASKQTITIQQKQIEQQSQLISQQKSQLHQQNEMISGLTAKVEREKKTNEEARMNVKQQLQNQINSAQNLHRTATTTSTNQLVHLVPLVNHIDSSVLLPVYLVSPLFHLSPADFHIVFLKLEFESESVGQDDGVIWITGKAENVVDICQFADVLLWMGGVVG